MHTLSRENQNVCATRYYADDGSSMLPSIVRCLVILTHPIIWGPTYPCHSFDLTPRLERCFTYDKAARRSQRCRFLLQSTSCKRLVCVCTGVRSTRHKTVMGGQASKPAVPAGCRFTKAPGGRRTETESPQQSVEPLCGSGFLQVKEHFVLCL